eukprot:TRINITY_DN1791_c0_g2_i2.p2 TRINITY_DN1791_c0_g2~~TRINITY_DN1791_c0_g2_i2.p2  ORF type:complete len:178 (-),score=14.52 TRINITY_DN1791_c0_g2_i2:156-614(-)
MQYFMLLVLSLIHEIRTQGIQFATIGCDLRTMAIYTINGTTLCTDPSPSPSPSPNPLHYLAVDISYNNYDDDFFLIEIPGRQITPSKDDVNACLAFQEQQLYGYDGTQITHCYPLSAVGRLQIFFEGISEPATCSGAMIDAHTVHCSTLLFT